MVFNATPQYDFTVLKHVLKTAEFKQHRKTYLCFPRLIKNVSL